MIETPYVVAHSGGFGGNGPPEGQPVNVALIGVMSSSPFEGIGAACGLRGWPAPALANSAAVTAAATSAAARIFP
jgi:hypothetical protein